MRSLWLWQLLLYGVFATKVTPTYQLMLMRVGLRGGGTAGAAAGTVQDSRPRSHSST